MTEDNSKEFRDFRWGIKLSMIDAFVQAFPQLQFWTKESVLHSRTKPHKEDYKFWQFFASRIPSMQQPDVEEVLANEKVAEDDVVALLKRVGKRTIANSFELKYNSAIG